MQGIKYVITIISTAFTIILGFIALFEYFKKKETKKIKFIIIGVIIITVLLTIPNNIIDSIEFRYKSISDLYDEYLANYDNIIHQLNKPTLTKKDKSNFMLSWNNLLKKMDLIEKNKIKNSIMKTSIVVTEAAVETDYRILSDLEAAIKLNKDARLALAHSAQEAIGNPDLLLLYHQQDVQLEQELKRLEMEYSALKKRLENKLPDVTSSPEAKEYNNPLDRLFEELEESPDVEETPNIEESSKIDDDESEKMKQLESLIKLEIDTLESTKKFKIETDFNEKLMKIYNEKEFVSIKNFKTLTTEYNEILQSKVEKIIKNI